MGRPMTDLRTPPSDKQSRTVEPLPAPLERAVKRAHRPLDWLWGRGFRFLFALDAIGLFAAMVVINLARFGTNWPTYPLSYYAVGFSIATVTHLVVGYFVGLYEREPRLGYRPWLPRIAVAMAIGVGFQGLIFVLTGRYLMPRLNLLVLLVLGTLILAANRSLSRTLANRRNGPSRVLLVGTHDEVRLARRHFELGGSDVVDAVVVGSVPDTSRMLRAVTDRAPGARPVTDVLLLEPAAFKAAFPEPLTALDEMGIGVHQRVGAHETLLGLQSVRQIAGLPFTRMRTHAMASHQLRLKRVFDVLVLLATAPITIPVVTCLALFVRIRAGSPVLYRQTRVGLNGKPFVLVKFRTMRPDAESGGPRLADRIDDRVIPKMAWMRALRADELPQLWNVVRGEMSLVGPRPERPELIAEFERRVPGYARRHELPPGLTGLAQVQGRYDTDPVYKLGYDLQYIVNWSVVLDAQLLARTVWVVITRRV
jgi:exopolysaccharide biosynthesis polyprenyl glycosylphosphotransferase